jgi:hypothetical protein
MNRLPIRPGQQGQRRAQAVSPSVSSDSTDTRLTREELRKEKALNARREPPGRSPTEDQEPTSQPLDSPEDSTSEEEDSESESSDSVKSELPDAPPPYSPRTTAERAYTGRFEEDMSKPVLFYGKTSQLENVLTHVSLKFELEDVRKDEKKCALLASTFRGQALSWYTNQLRVSRDLNSDYDEFLALVKSAFGENTEAKNAQDARKYANLYQKTSVQLYAITFQQLAASLGIPEATQVAQFKKGLKANVRNALIIQGESSTITKLIEDAIKLDSQFYSSNRGRANHHGGKGTTQGKNAGKCHSCGQFGHKAKDCKVKREAF